jgi:agmatine/peptidylarginine deiminase
MSRAAHSKSPGHAAIPVLLCLLAAGHGASAQDALSEREGAWSKSVIRALGGVSPFAPKKSSGRLTVTGRDARVTRELAGSPAAAHERAQALIESLRGGTLLVEVRGRQLVLVESVDPARGGLAALLDTAWAVLPGGDQPRTAVGLSRAESFAALALGPGAVLDRATALRALLEAQGGVAVGATLLRQERDALRAVRVGSTEGAYAVAPDRAAMRALLRELVALGATHGLQLEAERPGPAGVGEGRGDSRDASVTGAAQAPTERPDLTGAWSVHDQDDGPMREGAAPDMVRFSDRVAGEPDRYEVVFITAAGQTEGRATFDGQTLVVERDPAAAPSPPVSVGFVRVIDALHTGRPAELPASARREAPAAAQAPGRYTLRATARELEFTVVGRAAPDSAAPVHAFRRLAEPTVDCPAEWEASEEVLWAAGSAFRQFALAGVYATALRSTSGVTHRIFASSSDDELFLEDELASRLGVEHVDAMDALEVVVRPVASGSVWVRDFGPITVRRKADGARLAGDMGYFSTRPDDDALPRDYAATRGWDVIDLERLKLEGGNFMSDGRGKVYVTGRALEGGYSGANDSQRAVEDALFELGAREVCWVPRMTVADGTGHIDMFSKLLGESAVLVGRDAGGPHAAMLDDAARRYEAMGLTVERVDMARNPDVDPRARDLQTYTNALFIGRVAIVPQYDSPALDEAALEAYRRAGYTAVGADVRAVIGANGAIHCVSMQIPGGR